LGESRSARCTRLRETFLFSVMIDMTYMIYPSDNAISMFAIDLPAVAVCGIMTRAIIRPEIAGSGQ
jgi:hypothetical protein